MISVKIGNKYIEANVPDTSIEDILKLLVANCKISSISMGEIPSDTIDEDDISSPVSNSSDKEANPTSNASEAALAFQHLMEDRESELRLKHRGMSWDVAVFDYVITHPDEEYTTSIYHDLKSVESQTKTPDIVTGAVLRRLSDRGILIKIRRGAFRFNPDLVELL